jgi:hypothetical protein
MGKCSPILARELMNATTVLSLRQRPERAICAFIGLVLFAASSARAQDYPNRTVTIVAPSAPGGMYSILARLIGSKLERLYGQTFVVENRPGASSIAGAVFVAHAAPDGYTLMTAATTTMATNVSLHRNLPYDPLTDFIPIVQIARSPEVLLINATLPVLFDRGPGHARAFHPGRTVVRLGRTRDRPASQRRAPQDAARHDDATYSLQGPRLEASRLSETVDISMD